MQRSLRFEQYLIYGLFLVLFLAVVAPFAQALLLGLLVALVFFPLNQFFDRKISLPRPIKALLVMLVLSLIALLPVLVLGMTIFKDLFQFMTDLGTWLQSLPELLSSASGFLEKLDFVMPIDSDQLAQKLVDPLAALASFFAQKIGKLAASFPVFILEYLLFLLALFFGLLDGERLAAYLRRILPFEEEELNRLFLTATQVCRGVVLGAILAALTQGFLVGLGFAFSGIPRPVFFGLLAAFLSLVPLVGSAPVSVGGLIYLFTQGSEGAALILAVFFGLASVSDNIIKPWVLKGQAEIHPLLGFVGALGGLAVFGILGLFLGPLLVALTLALTEMFMQKRRI